MATGGNVGSLSISAKALFWGLLGGLTYAIYTIQSQHFLQNVEFCIYLVGVI